MSFDKTKAMRSAEKFLSQGKIRSAIGEYKRIVEENPKDFSTLNILGDLYGKNSEDNNAVECFRLVAEHYYGQGFANKAIAIYNKITRLQPNSMEIAARLAQLYQMRGSYAEAREQYLRLADYYQSIGKKIEALEVWKQIAELDPNNTEVYLTIAEACMQENQVSEAVDAYAQAGLRFNLQERYESAVGSFQKGLSIDPGDIKTLNGFVIAKISLGCADEAADVLEKVLDEDPYNRDILLLLIDCYVDMNNPLKCEQTVMKLVQNEPANYPKFLQVAEIYMKENDLESTVRVLSISFEHILGNGKAEEFLAWINEILTRNPEYIEGLRLLVRYHTWHRNEVEIRKSLERLAETARLNEAVEDERYALGQLALISPLQTEYSERLQELKAIYGAGEAEIIAEETQQSEIPEFETFAALNEDSGEIIQTFSQHTGDFDFADGSGIVSPADISSQNESGETVREFDFYSEDLQTNFNAVQPEIDNYSLNGVLETFNAETETKLSDELKLQTEIESIEFYITQGYNDLASKCLEALIEEFGQRPELKKLGQNIPGFELKAVEIEVAQTVEVVQKVEAPQTVEVVQKVEAPQTVEEKAQTDEVISPAVNIFEQFRSDLGLEDEEETDESDYSTHYHTAIAYKEMGLMEDAIKEFQDAINMVEMDDGTRRYFQCANLLGHCFMMKEMPNLAQTWFKRALNTADLNDEEIQAMHYELANAYEASGEKEKAFQHFEQVYALDVGFRDIGQRIQNLRENYSSTMIN